MKCGARARSTPWQARDHHHLAVGRDRLAGGVGVDDAVDRDGHLVFDVRAEAGIALVQLEEHLADFGGLYVETFESASELFAQIDRKNDSRHATSCFRIAPQPWPLAISAWMRGGDSGKL